MPVRPARTLTALAAVAMLSLAAACGGPADEAVDVGSSATPSPTVTTTTPTPSETATTASESPTPTPTPEPEPEPEGPQVDVVIEADKVFPNAVEIPLAVGEELTLTVDSDRAGELHVHSKPEQYVEFDAGRSSHTLVVETPGEVEVEEHETGAVVAVLIVE